MSMVYRFGVHQFIIYSGVREPGGIRNTEYSSAGPLIFDVPYSSKIHFIHLISSFSIYEPTIKYSSAEYGIP